MADQTNLLKFVSVRPSLLLDPSTPSHRIVVDARLWTPEPIATDRSISFDRTRATNCYPAQFVLERIDTTLPLCQTSKDVRTYNDQLAEEVRTQFGIGEKPDPSYVFDLAAVIARHRGATTFDRQRVISELEVVLKGPFPAGMTVDDFVYRDADNASHFCIALSAMFNRLYTLYIAKRRHPVNLEFVLDAIRALHLVYHLATRPTGPDDIVSDCARTTLGKRGDPNVGAMDRDRFEALADAMVCVHPVFSYLLAYYRPFNILRPVGIGDLKVVKQWICKYEVGEIAHVENVLLGEKKNRTHRILNRTESMTFSSEEKIEETQKDLESTERYELSKEVETTVQKDLGLELAATVSGSYGMVDFSVSTGVSFSMSSSESERTTSNYAKDVVSRSASKIQRSARDERTVTVVAETEETNLHGFDNENGDGHVTGIYRWLDKRYHAQIFNYGKRLMFEVLVPEPAAFVRYAAEKNRVDDSGPVLPVAPVKPAIAISTLNQATIDTYSTTFSLHDLEPEPVATILQTVTLQQSGLPATAVHQVSVAVPEGYLAVKADIQAAGTNVKSPGVAYQLVLLVGGTKDLLWSSPGGGNEYTDKTATMNFPGGVSTQLVGSVLAHNVFSYSIDMVVTSERSPAFYLAWQIRSYDRIIKAYEDQLAKYELAYSAYQRQLDALNARKALEIRGLNPKTNEQIIRIELKKHAVTMIGREFDTDATDDTVFDALGQLPTTEPAIDIDKTLAEAPMVQFLEQAFEWTQLTYLLYPYFWGNRTRWVESQKAYGETDPIFGRFLQAGYCRLLIPVRPAYETAVLHFLYTREPWNGGPAPGIYDPLYVSIHDEIRHEQDDLEGATPEGTPWDVVLPTSLIYLQPTADIPTFPC